MLSVCGLVAANVVSVVGVVACNKMLYQPPHNFSFASSLMTFHFICTWGFVVLAKKMGWYTEKKIEVTNYMKLGLAQAASVGFVNLSLLFNSVGMYQVLKFTNILVICAIEFFWKNKTYSCSIYACLFTLVMGVSVSTVTQIDMRPLGLFHGLMGSLSTAIYQIQNKSIQTECEVKPLQLLEFEQPFTALFAFIFAMLTDNVYELVHYQFTSTTVALLLMSGVFAFGVNVTCYLIIGKTSPVTYGVVGHTKTVMILLFGFMYMKEPVSMQNMAGMLIAFFSIIGYTHISTTQPQSKKDTSASSNGGDSHGDNSHAHVAITRVPSHLSDEDESDSTEMTALQQKQHNHRKSSSQ